MFSNGRGLSAIFEFQGSSRDHFADWLQSNPEMVRAALLIHSIDFNNSVLRRCNRLLIIGNESLLIRWRE